jgi:hypothetical protein
MIIMAHNKKWCDLTGRQEAPIMLRGIVLLALLAAAPVNCMGIGPIVYFVFGRKR